MERAGLFRVDDVPFMEEIMVSELVAEEAAGDVDLLAADDGNFLAREDLLGNDAGQATEQMAFAVDNDGARRECGHFEQSRRIKL